MGILFGEDPVGFLSVEAESTEQVSSEDLPSQVFSRRIPGTSKKREREEAFNPSPLESRHEPDPPRRRYDPDPSLGSDSGLPLSTCSPTKSRTKKDQSSSQNGQGCSHRSSEDPVSLFRKVEGATGTKSKQPPKSAVKLQDDGQHRDVSNCGCHRCIYEISITKMEKVTPGQGVSEKLRALIKSRGILSRHHWILLLHPIYARIIWRRALLRRARLHQMEKLNATTPRELLEHTRWAISGALSNLERPEERTQERICPHALRSPRKRLKEAKFHFTLAVRVTSDGYKCYQKTGKTRQSTMERAKGLRAKALELALP